MVTYEKGASRGLGPKGKTGGGIGLGHERLALFRLN